MRRWITSSAAALGLVLGSMAPGVALQPPGGAAAGAGTAVVAVAVTPTPTGMHTIVDVSKDGRIALGRMTETGPYVLRNLASNTTLRTLKSGPQYVYKSLSSTGRYVAYDRLLVKSGCTYSRPYVLDRVSGKSRLAATTRSGKALMPTWPQGSACAQFATAEARFGAYFHSGVSGPGQMSPDGRWVAFCANLTDPERGDLYIKDLKTRKLTVRTGECHMASEVQEMYAPHISEAGRTVLLPFTINDSTQGHAVDVLLMRKTLRPAALPGGSLRIQMADDGRTVFFRSGTSTDAGRYDVGSAAITPLLVGDPMRPDELAPGQEYREPQGITRRGRYASYHGSRVDPTTSARLGLIGVFDRDTGQSVDLMPALAAAGVPLQVGAYPNSTVAAEISGDGKVLFFPSPAGWMSLSLLP
jgi:hypothetical protein